MVVSPAFNIQAGFSYQRAHTAMLAPADLALAAEFERDWSYG